MCVLCDQLPCSVLYLVVVLCCMQDGARAVPRGAAWCEAVREGALWLRSQLLVVVYVLNATVRTVLADHTLVSPGHQVQAAVLSDVMYVGG
jgi:hypothetical protein